MLGKFLIPKGIMTIKGNPHDLEQGREDNLAQGSAWSPEFQNFLDTKHKNIGYIREFPIIIKTKPFGNLCAIYTTSHLTYDPETIS